MLSGLFGGFETGCHAARVTCGIADELGIKYEEDSEQGCVNVHLHTLADAQRIIDRLYADGHVTPGEAADGLFERGLRELLAA